MRVLAKTAVRHLFELLLIGLLLYKLPLVETRFVHYDCGGCLNATVVANDLLFFAAIFAALGLAFLTRNASRLFAAFLLVIAATLAAIYVFDILIIKLFATRLVYSDVVKFGGEVGAILTLGAQLGFEKIAGSIFNVVLFGIAVAQLRGRMHSPDARRHGVLFSAAAVVMIGIGMTVPSANHLKSAAVKNVFEINREQFSISDYPEAYRNGFGLAPYAGQCTRELEPQGKKVILLVVESWSNYHSAYFSGLNDYTPQMDRIAKENTSFLRFHANAYDTEKGLTALLTGRLPLPPPNGRFTASGKTSFDGFNGSRFSLPEEFARRGYESVFFTSGDLSFSDKGAFLKSIGFGDIYGHDDPAYAGVTKRFHFESVADELLLNRVFDWVSTNDQPFFAVVETVSTHHPLVDPVSGKPADEATVWRYADRVVAEFYEKLRGSGFFNDGMLIITSDHRAMTGIGAGEEKKFGEMAPAMIPLVVVDGTKAVVDHDFQQTDLHASLLARFHGEFCTDIARGNLFEKRMAPHCIAHPNGSWRNHVIAKCGSEIATIRIDGADTGPVGLPVEDSESFGVLVNRINYELIKREYPVTRRSPAPELKVAGTASESPGNR